ncbi:MAG: hypothetical protein GX610_13120 [Rhodococcus sp.]|nr:hypothetical protein [Rhodococcus sp. (in: high G+C Gram-positive bacteria)]
MADPTDPLELLRRLRPPRDPRPLERGDEPAMDAVLDGVLQRLETGARPRDHRARGRRRGRLLAAFLAVGVAGGASAAAAIWHETTRPDHRLVVSCWSDLQPSAFWEARIEPNDSPIDACGEPWTNGYFDTSGPPPLAACVTDSGIIAVVPGDQSTCATSGLTVLQPGFEPDGTIPDDERLHQLLAIPLLETCADEHDTVSLIDTVFNDQGLTDWTVDYIAQFDELRVCGQVSIDASSRTVWITPIPGPPQS